MAVSGSRTRRGLSWRMSSRSEPRKAGGTVRRFQNPFDPDEELQRAVLAALQLTVFAMAILLFLEVAARG